MEWTQQLVATQKQRTEKIRKETENMKAILDAERVRQVEAIRTSQHIEQEQGKANVTRIQNEVVLIQHYLTMTIRLSSASLGGLFMKTSCIHEKLASYVFGLLTKFISALFFFCFFCSFFFDQI